MAEQFFKDWEATPELCYVSVEMSLNYKLLQRWKRSKWYLLGTTGDMLYDGEEYEWREVKHYPLEEFRKEKKERGND